MFMLCDGPVRLLQAHMLYFLPTCMCICSYIYKVSDFRPCIFLFSFVFFEQDEEKVAFVSNRFENPLEDIVFLNGKFISKHKIRLLNLSQMTRQFFNIGITIFRSLTGSMEEDFSDK